MAPDIDSLSPRRPRRPSERVSSPSINLFNSGTPPRSPTLSSTAFQQASRREDNTGVDPGPGPMRHPRPLTAADLHMQLEKEQEAVVNRLTRELTLLRQQTASAASNTSSTSTGIVDSTNDPGIHTSMPTGSNYPTSSRRHRSSSNSSSRSGIHTTAPTTAGSTTTSTSSAAGTTAGISGSTTSTTGIAPPRDTTLPYRATDPLSRQSSVASSRRSDASSPAFSASQTHAQQPGGDHVFASPGHYPHRHSHTSSTASASATAPLTRTPSATSNAARSSYSIPVPNYRYDDAAHARAELEMVKQENEALKQRIRELERNLSHSAMGSRRESVTSQPRLDIRREEGGVS